MQVMRKQWIDEGKYKPGGAVTDTLPMDDNRTGTRRTLGVHADTGVVDITGAGPRTPPKDLQDDHDEDDLYSATPVAVQRQGDTENPDDGSAAENGGDREAEKDQIPEEDELDALLAEEDAGGVVRESHASTPQVYTRSNRPAEEQNFDDDMEAMAELGMEW